MIRGQHDDHPADRVDRRTGRVPGGGAGRRALVPRRPRRPRRVRGGHLPGAVFVDLERRPVRRTTSRPPRAAIRCRRPRLRRGDERLGIGDDSTVIAYDDTGGMTAGRLVVMLRMLGRDAAVLDGGMAAVARRADDRPGREPRARCDFTPCDVAGRSSRRRRRDRGTRRRRRRARARRARVERFTGEVAQIDPRPGHIPGAAARRGPPTLDPATGRFRPAAELRQPLQPTSASATATASSPTAAVVSRPA